MKNGIYDSKEEAAQALDLFVERFNALLREFEVDLISEFSDGSFGLEALVFHWSELSGPEAGILSLSKQVSG